MQKKELIYKTNRHWKINKVQTVIKNKCMATKGETWQEG